MFAATSGGLNVWKFHGATKYPRRAQNSASIRHGYCVPGEYAGDQVWRPSGLKLLSKRSSQLVMVTFTEHLRLFCSSMSIWRPSFTGSMRPLVQAPVKVSTRCTDRRGPYHRLSGIYEVYLDCPAWGHCSWRDARACHRSLSGGAA
jgi:hypothetical protein